MKWIISNHKDHLLGSTYQEEIARLANPNINIIICPNDEELSSFSLKRKNYFLGSQDINYKFSMNELKNMSIEYAIIGHSDRRKKYHETSQEIHEKIKKLIDIGICPILCIGEEQEVDFEKKNLGDELESCLKNIKINRLIVAYEPVWAIGSGKIPTKERLIEIAEYVKEKTKKITGITPILVYGGSVNENTITLLEEIKSLDGYLIGSASIDISKLKKLIEVIK